MIKYEIIDNFLNDSDYDQLVDYIMPRGYTPRTENVHTERDVAWDYVAKTIKKDSSQEESTHLKAVTNIKRLENWANKSDLNNYQSKIIYQLKNISKKGFGSASWTVVEPFCHFTK